MQEALDETLETERERELLAQIDDDVSAADEYTRLKRVDAMLREAPQERAPQAMAQSVMAKLAQSLNPQRLSRISGLALAISLSLVTLIITPVLIAAGLAAAGALGSAAALVGLIRGVVLLSNTSVAVLERSITALQAFLSAYPHIPLLMIALIPLALFLLIRLNGRIDRGDMA
jgi:anti-sigma factor RsiW